MIYELLIIPVLPRLKLSIAIVSAHSLLLRFIPDIYGLLQML